MEEMALDIPRNKELAKGQDAHRRPATLHGIEKSVQGIVDKERVKPKLHLFPAFYLPHLLEKAKTI